MVSSLNFFYYFLCRLLQLFDYPVPEVMPKRFPTKRKVKREYIPQSFHTSCHCNTKKLLVMRCFCNQRRCTCGIRQRKHRKLKKLLSLPPNSKQYGLDIYIPVCFFFVLPVHVIRNVVLYEDRLIFSHLFCYQVTLSLAQGLDAGVSCCQTPHDPQLQLLLIQLRIQRPPHHLRGGHALLKMVSSPPHLLHHSRGT